MRDEGMRGGGMRDGLTDSQRNFCSLSPFTLNWETPSMNSEERQIPDETQDPPVSRSLQTDQVRP